MQHVSHTEAVCIHSYCIFAAAVYRLLCICCCCEFAAAVNLLLLQDNNHCCVEQAASCMCCIIQQTKLLLLLHNMHTQCAYTIHAYTCAIGLSCRYFHQAGCDGEEGQYKGQQDGHNANDSQRILCVVCECVYVTYIQVLTHTPGSHIIPQRHWCPPFPCWIASILLAHPHDAMTSSRRL